MMVKGWWLAAEAGEVAEATDAAEAVELCRATNYRDLSPSASVPCRRPPLPLSVMSGNKLP